SKCEESIEWTASYERRRRPCRCRANAFARRPRCSDASTYSVFEDGTMACPDLTTALFWDDETGEVISADEYPRNWLGSEMSLKLEILRQEVVSWTIQSRNT